MTELSELFTQSAREVLPLARAKGLVSYFDYQGPYLELPTDHPGMRAGIHRVLLGLTDCIDAGFVMFTAEVRSPSDGSSEVVVHAAGTGTVARDEVVLQVLQRLQMRPAPPPRARGVAASGVCPATGGEVTFLDDGPEGLVISLKTSTEAIEAPGVEPLPDAAGVTAWLVSAVPGGLDSVHRRLRRLGWHVRSFQSLEVVRAMWSAAPNGRCQRPPMLLVTCELTGKELPAMEDMATTMPATRVVLAVLAGSPTVQARGATSVDIRLLPLNPLELEQFTAHVDWRTSTIESRETSPSPLYTQDARLILVVDDSPTNQLVARGQLETLGYEVAVASNGVDALAFCHRQAPDMVLMDIDMPVMGGLEAAERLRACQQTGTVPPFPIVAATAVDDALRRQQCLSVGMDGYLAKPMRLDALADEMHRVLPTRPVAAEQDTRSRVARGP